MKWPPKLPRGCPLTVTTRGYIARIAGKPRWICGKKPVTQAMEIYHRKASALVAQRKPLTATAAPPSGARATFHYILSRWLTDRRTDAERGTLKPATWTQYRLSGKRIDPIIGAHLTDDWSPSQTESLYRQLVDAHKEDFARRVIGHLSAACRHAAERDWCRPVRLGESVVAALASRPAVTMKWTLYTPAQVRSILAAADAAVVNATRGYGREAAVQVRAFIFLALNGGYGSKEASDLLKTDVNLAGAKLVSIRAKTGATHVIPLWTETVEALKPVLAHRPDDPLLFRTRQGKPWCRYAPILKGDKLSKISSSDNVNWRFRQLVKPLGLYVKGQGFYKLKHLFATTASEALDTEAAKLLRGHSLGVAAHYVAVGEDRLRKVVDHVRFRLLLEPLSPSTGRPIPSRAG